MRFYGKCTPIYFRSRRGGVVPFVREDAIGKRSKLTVSKTSFFIFDIDVFIRMVVIRSELLSMSDRAVAPTQSWPGLITNFNLVFA